MSVGDHYICVLFDIGTKMEFYCWGNNVDWTLGNNYEEDGTCNVFKVVVVENDNKDW